MVKEGRMGQPMEQHPLWKEFSSRAMNGEFDVEIEEYWGNFFKKVHDDLERMERPTTPEDLIDSVVMKDLMEHGPRGPFPFTEEEMKEAAERVSENIMKDVRLPKDVLMIKRKMIRRERFIRDPANFQKFLKGREAK